MVSERDGPTAPADTVRELQSLVDAVRTGSVPGEFADAGGPFIAALTALRELRGVLAGWEPELVEAARAAGVSWALLAPALGVTSRQAAERRYLRTRSTGGAE